MPRARWFEIADEGLTRLVAGRPLGRLLLEAVQNAFDERAANVSVELARDRVVVTDDAAGVGDERLVYTVFLTGKAQTAAQRGRMGRGLKELVAAMDRATVETAGTTIVFDEQGRHSRANERARGTVIMLERSFTDDDLASAEAILRLCIAPTGTALRVQGRTVRRPRRVLELPSCELETVVVAGGVESAAMSATTVTVSTPRRGELPHLYEMGIPVEPWDVPFHADVAQRVPLGDGRTSASERFKLALRATLLEAMIHRYMDRRDLRADWVHDVISRWPLPQSVLDAYVSKLFPRGAVLEGTTRGNDRALQLGAHIVESAHMTHGAYVALARVLETADDYVRRRGHDLAGQEVAPDAVQARFADSVRWLARRVAGRVVRVRFFAREAADDGLIEDATTDAEARVIRFNVRASLRFDDVLDATTLGVVLHELAHLDSPEHDQRFVDRLGQLAGQCARLFAERGPVLAEALRRGDPDAK